MLGVDRRGGLCTSEGFEPSTSLPCPCPLLRSGLVTALQVEKLSDKVDVVIEKIDDEKLSDKAFDLVSLLVSGSKLDFTVRRCRNWCRFDAASKARATR